MISDIQIDDWLKLNTRMTGQGLVWPKGTLYSMDVSRKIVRTYIALGLEPNESVTIDLVSSLVTRLETLEYAMAEGDRRRSSEARMRALARQDPKELDTQFAASVLGIPPENIIREGDPRMNLVQDLIEGDARRQDWARRLLAALEIVRPEDRALYIEEHPYTGEGDGS